MSDAIDDFGDAIIPLVPDGKASGHATHGESPPIQWDDAPTPPERDALIVPCVECRGVYGQHFGGCSVPKLQNSADVTLGAELLSAIHEGDALAIGRLLRRPR